MREYEDVARVWMSQASYDLESARLMMREGFYSHVCFMSQQVAEKTLKALAYYRGDTDARGHTIKALLISLEMSYPDLSRFYEIVDTLEAYYIPTRYPDALPSGAPYEIYQYEDAEDALYSAEQIFDFARTIIPQN